MMYGICFVSATFLPYCKIQNIMDNEFPLHGHVRGFVLASLDLIFISIIHKMSSLYDLCKLSGYRDRVVSTSMNN